MCESVCMWVYMCVPVCEYMCTCMYVTLYKIQRSATMYKHNMQCITCKTQCNAQQAPGNAMYNTIYYIIYTIQLYTSDVSFMKSMLTNTMKADVAYKPLCTEESIPLPLSWKQKWLPCGSFTRRMYILMILSGVVLMWIFIYYKLLHHHFELPEPLRELRKMFGDGEVKKRRGREDETENITPVPKNPCLRQFKEQRNKEVIHFAVVACNKRYEDALLSMKSITLVTNYKIYFHIFTNKKHIKEETFDRELKLWPAWTQRWMMFTVHPISYPVNEDNKDWFKRFKPCSSQSLFLARILVDVDALIYIDTDVLFLEAPENLWHIFNNFDESHIAALAFECGSEENCWYKNGLPYPYFKPYGLNSGVMLMNLTRMRMLRWENQLVEIYLTYKKHLAYGDQDILNIFFQLNKKTLHKLSCYWNYRPHLCINGNVCLEAEKNGISALHGSGQIFQKSNLQGGFYLVNEAFRNFKFEDNFQEKIVNSTKDLLSFHKHKYNSNPCSKMLDAILKHITCSN